MLKKLCLDVPESQHCHRTLAETQKEQSQAWALALWVPQTDRACPPNAQADILTLTVMALGDLWEVTGVAEVVRVASRDGIKVLGGGDTRAGSVPPREDSGKTGSRLFLDGTCRHPDLGPP